ncbi:MAG: enolase C-terminal domain-like protein [Saprospiraceae bacterium]
MKKDRRKFLKNSAALLSMGSFFQWGACSNVSANTSKATIENIELFRYDINIPRYFSFGTWHNRQHLFMKISSGDFYGWSEVPASINNPDFDPSNWVNYLKQYIGLDIYSAQKLIWSQQKVGTSSTTKELELIEIGLLDLIGRIENRPSVEILGLQGRKAVPGLYCILQKDIAAEKKRTRECVELNLNHLKFKMFGEKELDLQILKTIRKEIGEEAVVISDANKGYKKWNSLEELALILNEFQANGLNAIEDPAKLETNQWIQLQNLTQDLALIPDYPLRPAWESMENIRKGMGEIYNLHPSFMGSLKYSVALSKKIKSYGAKVMVGDDSLVGPACTAWQQIAIGANAAWVEAIEKKGDSDPFLDCIISSATKPELDGTYSFTPKPGFGLELDEEKLKGICAAWVSVK